MMVVKDSFPAGPYPGEERDDGIDSQERCRECDSPTKRLVGENFARLGHRQHNVEGYDDDDHRNDAGEGRHCKSSQTGPLKVGQPALPGFGRSVLSRFFPAERRPMNRAGAFLGFACVPGRCGLAGQAVIAGSPVPQIPDPAAVRAEGPLHRWRIRDR